MATEADIAAHDALLNRTVDQFEQGLGPIINDVFAELANIGITQDRLAVQRAFAPVTAYVIAQVGSLDSIVTSIVDVNQDTVSIPLDSQQLQAIDSLKTSTQTDVQTVVDTETNRIVSIIVLAAIAGAVSTNLIRQTRQELAKSRARIATAFANSVYQFNTVVTRLRAQIAGVKRYRYVGGTIATSRDFCRRLDGGVFTEEQIRNLWRSNWSGKAPGDPMVVRGGYNCRHFWVPVANE